MLRINETRIRIRDPDHELQHHHVRDGDHLYHHNGDAKQRTYFLLHVLYHYNYRTLYVVP